jgi:hypothetical protein
MTQTAKIELAKLSEGVIDIVTQAASRRLVQVLEFVHEEYIAPRDKRIAELEAQVLRLGRQTGKDGEQ